VLTRRAYTRAGREKRDPRAEAPWFVAAHNDRDRNAGGEEARSGVVRGAAEDPTGVDLPRGGARRLGREYPEGVKVLAEYWMQTDLPRVVAILEAENLAPFGAIRMHRGDRFGIEVFPAMTCEPGMEMLRQAKPQQG
jgi:hypothetical protein